MFVLGISTFLQSSFILTFVLKKCDINLLIYKSFLKLMNITIQNLQSQFIKASHSISH